MMKKNLSSVRLVLFSTLAAVLCQPAFGQETATLSDLGGVDLVAEIRILKLPVSIDSNDVQQCDVLNQLLRSTDVRNVEVQCPSQADDSVVQDHVQQVNGTDELQNIPVNPANKRRNSVLVVRMKDPAVSALLKSARGGTQPSIVQAPTVTMHSGQSAEIMGGTQRPFVTGYREIVGDFATAWQPIISVVPEGFRVSITATADADNIAVEASVEDWKISSAEEFTMAGDGDREITLQVPVVNVDSVNATGTVVSGESLLLIPGSAKQDVQAVKANPIQGIRKAFGAVPQETPTRTAILITMRTVDQVSINLPAPPAQTAKPDLSADQPSMHFFIGLTR